MRRLDIERQPSIINPEAANVYDALTRLSGAGPRFAILCNGGENYYIQTHINDSGFFAIEFREGGPDRHYIVDDSQPREGVIDAFLDYLGGGNRWRTAFEWRRQETS